MSQLVEMTARDLIRRSLMLIGVIGEGETPSHTQANDALLSLNEIVDTWNVENLMISSVKNVDIPLDGSSMYTIGPSGDIVTNLTDSITKCYYEKDDLVYKIAVLTNTQFDEISLKNQIVDIPYYITVNYTSPNAELRVYPISNSGKLVITHNDGFTGFETLDEIVNLPSGYLKALRYNLAVDLRMEYNLGPDEAIAATAVSSKARVKILNGTNKKQVMTIDGLRRGFNIYSGDYE